jgi:hypothetical protein
VCKTPPPIQAANTEINQHLDGLKKQLEKGEISQTEYDSKLPTGSADKCYSTA